MDRCMQDSLSLEFREGEGKKNARATSPRQFPVDAPSLSPVALEFSVLPCYRNPPPVTIISHCTVLCLHAVPVPHHRYDLFFFFLLVLGKRKKKDDAISSTHASLASSGYLDTIWNPPGRSSSAIYSVADLDR